MKIPLATGKKENGIWTLTVIQDGHKAVGQGKSLLEASANAK